MYTVLKSLGVVAAVAALLTLGVLSVAAQTVPNDSPLGAVYIDGQTHTAPVGKSLWYKFDYTSAHRAQDRSEIFLTLPGGANKGVDFSVYTFDQVNDDLADGIENWRDEKAVGQGTPNGSNLTWVGKFANSGPVFVRVRNLTEAPKDFTLTVEGTDVSLGPNVPVQTILQGFQ
jgi:hypothetical protein